jgi:hypothetical protein
MGNKYHIFFKKVELGTLLPHHQVPLMYWLTTRMQSLPVAMVHRFGWQIIIVIALGGGLQEIVAFFIAWACFKSLYELGYFMNDFYAAPREKGGRIKLSDAGLANNQSTHLWLKMIVPRIFFSITMGFFLWYIAPNAMQAWVTFALIMFAACTFVIHNAIAPTKRPLTYFLLNLTKGALIVPFVLGSLDDLAMWSCIVAPTISMTAYYSGHKQLPSFLPYRKYLVLLAWQLRLSVLLLTTCFIIIWLMQGNPGILLPVVILYYLIYDFLTCCGTFIKATKYSKKRRDLIQHVHSEYSHDSIIPLESCPYYATEAGFKVCFMTEHAEDFNYSRYEEYKSSLALMNGSNNKCQLIPGLEYPILKQHILACNLVEFINVDSLDIKSIDLIRNASDKVVWAHPIVSRRRLMSPKYISEILGIALRVDGIEWASGKFDRVNSYNARMHLAIAFIIHLIWPQKEIYFGYDIHRVDDWIGLIASN